MDKYKQDSQMSVKEQLFDCDGRCLNCDYFNEVSGCTIDELDELVIEEERRNEQN